jgi:hypothetical protein
MKKRSYIELYMPHISDALKEILTLTEPQKKDIEEKLAILMEKTRGKVEDMSFDPDKNEDYDEDLASIGKEDESYDNPGEDYDVEYGKAKSKADPDEEDVPKKKKKKERLKESEDE